MTNDVLKQKIYQAVQEENEYDFYYYNGLLIYKKEFPDFFYKWTIELPQLAKERHEILVIQAPRNHLKTTALSIFKPFWFLLTHPLSEAWLFSYSVHQAKEFLLKLKNIVEYYYPEIIKPDNWSKMNLTFINGSSYKVGSISSTYYGVHPDLIICDDILGGEGDPSKIIKSNLPPGYVEERFFSMIIPMLSPTSQMIVVGVPFYVGDIYSKMEQIAKTEGGYMICKFPAVIDEKQKKVLWEKERPYDWLMKQKKKIGSQRFAREYLLQPYDAQSSLLSRTLLEQCLDYTLTCQSKRLFDDSIVVIGADFSISGHIGADFCVFTAIEYHDGKIYILDWEKFKEADYHIQLAKLEQFYKKYNADLIVIENIAFQRIYAQELVEKMLPIKEHHTHTEKHTFDLGIPSLKIHFEKGQIILPAGDEKSRQKTEEFIQEMQGFNYINKKVVHFGNHDDMAMSFYLAMQGLRSLIALDDNSDTEISDDEIWYESLYTTSENKLWRII